MWQALANSFHEKATALAVLRVRPIVGFGPPTLKRWKERRKTFFEWLYDRDSLKDLFSRRH
jgi:hypothetical protein